MSSSNDEGQVTAVVAKVRYKATKIGPTGEANNPVGVAPVTKSSDSWMGI